MKTVEITYRYGSSSQCPRRAVSLAQRAMHPALVE